jgi:hypothetical protein
MIERRLFVWWVNTLKYAANVRQDIENAQGDPTNLTIGSDRYLAG